MHMIPVKILQVLLNSVVIWICPPQFMGWILAPKGDGIRRWGLGSNWVMTQLGHGWDQSKRLQRDPMLLLTCEGPVRRSQLWTGKWALTRYQVCHCLDVGFPSLQNCEKYLPVVYKPPSLWFSVIAAWTDKEKSSLTCFLLLLFPPNSQGLLCTWRSFRNNE